MTAVGDRPDGAQVHLEDALSRGTLAPAVLASVVGTVITASLGTNQAGTLAGAAISPVIAALFTTKRVGVVGQLRVMAVVVLTLAAFVITVVGFTLSEAVAGTSLIADRPATFLSLEPDTGPRTPGTPTATEIPSLGPTNGISPEPTETARGYVVQSGDTLSSIAEKFYGDPGLWGIIVDANNLADPDNIAVGTRLTIPPKPSIEPAPSDIAS